MPIPVDSLFLADYVLTQNDEHTLLHKAGIAVREDTLIDIDLRDELLTRYEAINVYELGEAALLPGLINGHTHAAMSFLRGRADDKPLMDWLTQDIFPVEAHLTPHIVRISTLLSCMEMLRTGTTGLCDMYMLADAVSDAVHQAGLRARIGESVIIYPTASYANGDEALDKARALIEKQLNHPLIGNIVLPHAIYTTDADFLTRCLNLAQEYNIPLGLHLSETQGETQNCLTAHGCRPVDYCHKLGLLTPQTVIFHGVDLNDEDLRILEDTGTSVIHNPTSNMKLASGVAPVPALLRHNIPVGLGSDGPASNNVQNIFREMTMAALLQKVHSLDATALPAQTALDMATRLGAQALGLRDVGALIPGYKADFCALKLTDPHLSPLYDIPSHLVYAASGYETVLTVVNGHILYKDGQYTTIDAQAVLEEMDSIKRYVLNLR